MIFALFLAGFLAVSQGLPQVRLDCAPVDPPNCDMEKQHECPPVNTGPDACPAAPTCTAKLFGTDGAPCADICPLNCGTNQMACPGPVLPDGCSLPGDCVATKIPGSGTLNGEPIMCDYFCLPHCLPGQNVCPLPDNNGCPVKPTCAAVCPVNP